MKQTPPTTWTDRTDRFVQALVRDEEKTKFRDIKTMDNLMASLAVLKTRHQNLSNDRVWTGLSKVMTLLKPVAQATDMLARASTPSESLWGQLGLVTDVIGSCTAEILESIIQQYDDLLSALPRVQDFTDALPQSPSLGLAMIETFEAYTTISIRSLRTYNQRSKVMAFFAPLLWNREKKLFRDSVSELNNLSRKAQNEAGYALSDKRKAEDSEVIRRLQLDIQEIKLDMRQQLPRTNSISSSAVATVGSRSVSTQNAQSVKFNLRSRNRSFVGRDERFREIHASLQPPHDAAEPEQQRCVVLCGMGGVGKTETALEYGHRYRNSYEACFWVTCDTETKATEGFADIAHLLGLEVISDTRSVGTVLGWLNESDDPWLLILDNAISPTYMKQFLPGSSNGSIIITTQDRSWLRQRHYITKGIPLVSLTEEEGTSLVMKLFEGEKRPISRDDAYSIFKEMGGLPLALRQITAYILETEMPVPKFLLHYHDPEVARAVDSWADSTTPWYSHTLSTVLTVSFQKLTARAQLIIGIISFFDVERVQERLLYDEKAPLDEPDRLFRVRLSFDPDISQLCRYDLVTKVTDASGRDELYLNTHRQVRRHVLSKLSTAELEAASSWAVGRLRTLFPRQSAFAAELNDGDPNCAFCIKHVLALKSSMDVISARTSRLQELASLYLDGGIYLWTKGLIWDGQNLTGEAKRLSDSASIHLEASITAQIYSFHASILSDGGNPEEASQYFAKSAELLRHHLTVVRDTANDSEKALLANAWNNLAAVYNAMGNYREAERQNELSLKYKQMLEAQGLPMSHLLCLSYLNTADTYAKLERYEDATEFYQKALASASNDASALRRALANHNFGRMKLIQNQVEEAQQLFETAFLLRLEKLGENHTDTAVSLHMRAHCFHLLGDEDSLKIARGMIQKSLEMLQSNKSNKDESRIARALFKLSLVQEALHEAEATVTRQEAEKMYQSITKKSEVHLTEGAFDDLVPYT